MLDARMRQMLAPVLAGAGARLAAAGVPAAALTGVGWAAGAGACAATALHAWPAALGLWLANRLLDGLDGPTARAAGKATEAGGFLDIVADFSVYAGIVLGLAVAVPGARLACVALLTAYYVSGTAFLALSSLAERRGAPLGDERSLRFIGGLAEGTETVVVYALLFLLPGQATVIAWAFAAAVAVTAAQRVIAGLRLLRVPALAGQAAGPAGRGTRPGPVPVPVPVPRRGTAA
jgi:phosphatidylglycerophosphate synthase